MKTTPRVPLVRERSTVQSCPAAPFSAENSTFDRQASADDGRTGREPGAADVGKSLDLLKVAAEQWAHKSPADQEIERRFIARDYAAAGHD
jgi:hypothetical protein